MSVFETAISTVVSAAARLAGVTITYQRGAAEVEITAVHGESNTESTDGATTVDAVTDDWIVAAADLVLSSVAVEPAPDDVILAGHADGTTHRYRVVRLGSEPCWRKSDRRGEYVRIHTIDEGAGDVGT